MSSTLRLTYLNGIPLTVTLAKIDGDDAPAPAACTYDDGQYTADVDVVGTYYCVFKTASNESIVNGYARLKDGQIADVVSYQFELDLAAPDVHVTLAYDSPITPYGFIGPGYSASQFTDDDRTTLAVNQNKLNQVLDKVEDLPTDMVALGELISSRLSTADYYNPSADLSSIKNSTGSLSYSNGRLDVNVQAVNNRALSDNVADAFVHFYSEATPSKTLNDVGVAGPGLTAQQVWEYATRTVSSHGTLVADVATAVHATPIDANIVSVTGTEVDDVEDFHGAGSGGAGFTVADIWSYETRSLTESVSVTPGTVILYPGVSGDDDILYFEITQRDDYENDSEIGPIGPIRIETTLDLLAEENAPRLRFGATQKTGGRYSKDTHFIGSAYAEAVAGEENQYDIYIEVTREETNNTAGTYGWDVEAVFSDDDVRTLLPAPGLLQLRPSMGDNEERDPLNE